MHGGMAIMMGASNMIGILNHQIEHMTTGEMEEIFQIRIKMDGFTNV
jgi:hypothetical protein